MPFTNQPVRVVRSLAIVAVLLVVTVFSVPGAAQAPSLEGAWRATQSAGTQNFFLLMDFSTGGVARGADETNQPGVGVWKKNSGGNYSATFEEFRDGNGDGNADSRMRFRATIQLSGANSFTGTLTADLMSLDGTVFLSTIGNGTLTGTRMAVVPE